MGAAQPRTATESKTVNRRVVVAGDLTMDWHLARTRRFADSGDIWNSEDRTEVYGQLGGAALTARLMTEIAGVLAAEGITVEVYGPGAPAGAIAPADPRFHHSYAIWSQYPRRQDDREHTVWRVETFLGLDPARTPEAAAFDEVAPSIDGRPAGTGRPSTADLVILDDADLGFRDQPERWPAILHLADSTPGAAPAPQPWILLKMAYPVASGELWRRILRLCSERLIVVMTLHDLRLSEVRISRELSWERIASDLAEEVLRHPAVNGLAHCAHVVVSLRTGGAVLLSRRQALAGRLDRLDRPDCYVFFDPPSIENSWAEQYPGAMIGYTSCLAGGIARELLLDSEQPDIHRGVRSGLAAGRTLHLQGYGAVECDSTRAGLAFPACVIARELAKEPHEFAVAKIEQPMSPSWSILEGRYPEGLESVAEAVAREGVEVALEGVPLGIFGKFLTVDRSEIEGYRSIRALMREYHAHPAPRPLNIAVFGPPGAGKSFGVKAVATSVLEADQIWELNFNVSQMRDPSELIDAFHRVRDAGLRGKLPFVLWDEFDSDLLGTPFGWLRHFLAPMQDGAFQEGQILHPIGKAIFVFAGGTSARLADFAGNQSQEFRLAKGPDFASRLKGHVDIVGPDPRDGDPEADPHYRIRRAILLRSILLRDRPELFEQDAKIIRLKIDSGVLRAFLGVRSYRHGARSLETIVAMSRLHGESRYERSALPAADQLDAHVDAREFLSLVERYVPEGGLLERLAEAVHLEYCREMLEQGYPWNGAPEYLTSHPMLATLAGCKPAKTALPALVGYDRLPEHLKEQNRGVARDLPGKLAILGYVLREDAPAGAPEPRVDPTDPRVNLLAKREHERWLERKLKTGWRYGDPRDDARRLHPSVRPWEELADEERDKDRMMVLKVPAIVAAAGLTLARTDELPALRIGVSGHRVLADRERVEIGIEEALARIEASYPGRPLTIVSALAEGADRLLAEAVLKRPGSRLEAVLPLPKFELLSDFASPESKEEFLRFLGRADAVTELPVRTSRDEAYAAANDHMLEDIDVLVAIWDGQSTQGHGGTAEVVAHARSRGLPLIWVHAGNREPGTMEPTSLGAEQGSVTYENFRPKGEHGEKA